MITYRQIDTCFETFLSGPHKYKRLIVGHSKRTIAMTYETHFIDEWGVTGYIYSKGLFAKNGQLIMFKGKPFKRIAPPSPPLPWWRWIKHMRYMRADVKVKEDWSMRKLAERSVCRKAYLTFIMSGVLLALFVGIYWLYQTFFIAT